VSLADEVRDLLEGTTPKPWLTPAEAGGPYEVKVLDHEGCQVWPWAQEEDMVLAYRAPTLADYLLQALELLERAQRSGDGASYSDFCAICYRSFEKGDDPGHAPGCKLAHLLRQSIRVGAPAAPLEEQNQ
jgi:hypothetical protein